MDLSAQRPRAAAVRAASAIAGLALLCGGCSAGAAVSSGQGHGGQQPNAVAARVAGTGSPTPVPSATRMRSPLPAPVPSASAAPGCLPTPVPSATAAPVRAPSASPSPIE